jgi:hypothetical protein
VIDVTIDHATGVVAPSSSLIVPAGGRLRVTIADTHPECFSYNYTSKEIESKKEADRVPIDPDFRAPVRIGDIVHDGKDRDYEFVISRRARSGCDGVQLPERSDANPIVVQVRTYRWGLAFAGGFTIDRLTDPVFSLKPATKVEGESKVQGFTPIRNRSKENDYTLGASAMIHLIHNSPEKWWTRNLAPVTFGLSVTNDSDVRYFLGTSWRAADQLFLTAGIVFGSEDTLPSGLDFEQNSFTTDANALQNLGSRTDHAIFVGISYSFLGSKDPFEKVLKSKPSSAPSAAPAEAMPEPEAADALEQLSCDPAQPEAILPGQSASLAIRNGTGLSLTLMEVVLEGQDSAGFMLDQGNCQSALAAGSSCNLTVRLDPNAAESAVAKITVRTDRGDKTVCSIESKSGA